MEISGSFWLDAVSVRAEQPTNRFPSSQMHGVANSTVEITLQSVLVHPHFTHGSTLALTAQLLRARRGELVPTSSYALVRTSLIATLLAAPLAFGAVQAWAWGALAVVAFLLLLLLVDCQRAARPSEDSLVAALPARRAFLPLGDDPIRRSPHDGFHCHAGSVAEALHRPHSFLPGGTAFQRTGFGAPVPKVQRGGRRGWSGKSDILSNSPSVGPSSRTRFCWRFSPSSSSSRARG